MQDQQALKDLKDLAASFFREETEVRLLSLASVASDIPPSLAEKKSLEQEDRRQRLSEQAMKHPAVAAALEVFGGRIADIKDESRS
jgi:DNA polymerase III subunit gamma/tau